MNRLVDATLGLALAALFAPLVAAQSFPAKPVRIIVGTAPGPGVDYVARVIGPKMSEDLGQPLVFENQSGGNGIIGTSMVVRAPADGYTVLMATPSMIVTAKLLIKDLPYEPLRDLAAVSCAVDPLTSLIANPSFPPNNITELVDWAKKNPGKVSYGSSGMGSMFHMIGEMFNEVASVQMVHVPYRSVPPSVQAVVAGDIQVAYAAISNALPQARAGKVKILGILEKSRWPVLPEVPTVAESLPDFEKPPSWFGYLAPAATPQPVIRRLNAAIVKSLGSADVRKALQEQGLNIVGNTPEQFTDMIKVGFVIYAKAIKIAGLKPE
jgi:tripartite-type tricarboxylate transporter receptor subunit TctC